MHTYTLGHLSFLHAHALLLHFPITTHPSIHRWFTLLWSALPYCVITLHCLIKVLHLDEPPHKSHHVPSQPFFLSFLPVFGNTQTYTCTCTVPALRPLDIYTSVLFYFNFSPPLSASPFSSPSSPSIHPPQNFTLPTTHHLTTQHGTTRQNPRLNFSLGVIFFSFLLLSCTPITGPPTAVSFPSIPPIKSSSLLHLLNTISSLSLHNLGFILVFALSIRYCIIYDLYSFYTTCCSQPAFYPLTRPPCHLHHLYPSIPIIILKLSSACSASSFLFISHDN